MAEVEERYIYEHGWPVSTPHDESVPATIQACQQECQDQGWQMLLEPAPEVTLVQTPEHEAAGEYIVSLRVRRRKVIT
jgi:hypothetical protein